jgi:transcriptional regulator with XRE-family HTH domain
VTSPRRTDQPFHEAVLDLLSRPDALPEHPGRRGWTMNSLAVAARVSQPVLWRMVRSPHERKPTNNELRRIADALALPPDYFLEWRLCAVTEALRAEPERLNRIYDRFRREQVLTGLPPTPAPQD